MNDIITDMNVNEIKSNPMNPRKKFNGPEFDALVSSIRNDGVLEPVIARRTESGDTMLIAGERRLRAVKKLSEESEASLTIPVIVKEMDDDQAFRVMIVENLIRQDLTPLEEAVSFKKYIGKGGDESIFDLSEKTGIKPHYIRKRIKVLELPKEILKSWQKGELVFGHLEQFLRLPEKEALSLFENLKSDDFNRTVSSLKAYIDRCSLSLADTLFDTEDCNKCGSNSVVQESMFNFGVDNGARCLDESCYSKKVQETCSDPEKWKGTSYYKNYKTNRVAWKEDVKWDEFEPFGSKLAKRKKCKDCESYVTILYKNGHNYTNMACVGPKKCYKEVMDLVNGIKKKEEKENAKADKDAPRVYWHGSFFREEFYKGKITERLAVIPDDDVKVLRLSLYSMLKVDKDFKAIVLEKFNVPEKTGIPDPSVMDEAMQKRKEESEEKYGYWIEPTYGSTDTKLVFDKIISGMSAEEVRTAMKLCVDDLVSRNSHGDRNFIADYLDIDLMSEFCVTEEYLKKKTISELKDLAKEFDVIGDEKARSFVYGIRKDYEFDKLKKKEWVDLFINSGMDLKGKVPKEIAISLNTLSEGE